MGYSMGKRSDDQVEQIVINRNINSFEITIFYLDGKKAVLTSDGLELKWVFDTIRKQIDA